MTLLVGGLAFIGAVVLLGAIALVAAFAFSPDFRADMKRAQMDQERFEASWRIHQQATAAFSQMLQAAREAEREQGQ